MNIGIIYSGLYPPYNRGIDQLAQSLLALGYRPMIVARSQNGEQQEEAHGIPLIQIPKTSINSLYLLHQIPFNPFWTNLLVKLGEKNKWEKIIVRDLPLAGSVLKAAEKLKIPAYQDLRENHTSMYQNEDWLCQVTHHPKLVKWYENLTIGKFQHIFTVSEELKQHITSTYSLGLDKVSVLENTPNEMYLQGADIALKGKKTKTGAFRMVYAGYIVECKGLLDIVRAMPLILQKNPNVQLCVIGVGPFLKQLKLTVVELGLSEAVEFMPMLNMVDLTKAISQSDLGLETCWLNDHTHLTIPGKLFEYMALGVPVLSSARNSVKRILDEVGCGCTYQTRQLEEIASIVNRLVSDDKARSEMGRRGREAILKRYNWRHNLELMNKCLQ